MRVAVVGLGYVGAVTAACLADLGHEVVGVDVDPHKVSLINASRSPIVEPGLEERIARARAAGRLRAQHSLSGLPDQVEVFLICVGTPTGRGGAVDLSNLEQVIAEIGAACKVHDPSRFHAVVVRSTVPPGTVDGPVRALLAERSGLRVDEQIGLAHCPEFLREGSGVADFLHPPFTVAGVRDDRTAELLAELFGTLDAPVHRTTVTAAEALKYACNAFHAVKITFANEMGRLMGALGVDGREVMRIFCEDHQLNLSAAYLRPGFAFGGSCLPKDLRALLAVARKADAELPMLAAVLPSNEALVQAVTRRVLELGIRNGALLGLSFKPETDDLRESPYVELAEALSGKGVRLRIYDPVVRPDRLFGSNRRYVDEHLPHLRDLLQADPATALAGAEVAVVANPAPAGVAALLAAPPPRILDLCGRLGPQVEALPGYEGVAW
jgi:GDP-mannose 6-dehydrogenase